MRGSDPRGGYVNVLKVANTVFSAAVVGFAYRASWLGALRATNNMDNFVLYMGETLFMALNMLRLYFVQRVC
jgi:hypothetical protein